MPRQNCNSMPVFAVTVYSVFTNSLELVVQEAQPRLAFLYLNMKSIKKLVTPEVAPDKK